MEPQGLWAGCVWGPQVRLVMAIRAAGHWQLSLLVVTGSSHPKAGRWGKDGCLVWPGGCGHRLSYQLPHSGALVGKMAASPHWGWWQALVLACPGKPCTSTGRVQGRERKQPSSSSLTALGCCLWPSASFRAQRQGKQPVARQRWPTLHPDQLHVAVPSAVSSLGGLLALQWLSCDAN